MGSEILQVPGDLQVLDRQLDALPGEPAVFAVWPRQGEPYIGRTGLLRRRLKRLLGERGPASRFLSLRQVAARVEYWRTGSRLETSYVFYRLARRIFPETYGKLVKLWMPPYVRLLLANPFPRSQVTTRLGGGRSLHYGPFPSRAAAEAFESQFLDLFQIRRCQEELAPSPDHPGCIYGEMNMCLRPCQQAVSREEYGSEAARAAEFLASGGRSLVDTISALRDRLSEEMSFEDAAREHKRIEKIRQMLQGTGGLATDIDRLCGVAVTASADPGAVELWFVSRGCWRDPRTFRVAASGEKSVSMDHRLREVVAALEEVNAPARERQEHIALLARWYFSSWRDGEWLPCNGLDEMPYRKLVNAISRVAKQEATAAPEGR